MAERGGQPGNKNGSRNKPFEDKLRLALAGEDWKALRRIADNAVKAAVEGEPWAIQFVADRLDGKPKQQIDIEQTITRQVREVSDDELQHIAAGGGNRAAKAPRGPEEPPVVH